MEQKLKTDFDKFISTSNFSNQEIKLKKQALDNFLKNGFPSRKLENWKFSDINQIIQKNIGELAFYNDYNIENEINDDIFIKGIEHNKIVIINGLNLICSLLIWSERFIFKAFTAYGCCRTVKK